ncbi:peptidoglycan-associated lipoprotein Pal [Sphingomonas panacisoli]|uniref:Peptidoglycan-associated lipoprotein n=1 Tax=Sphingomonas panacisoli TaxID=1813879 RepID=A0A5B8LLF4_9SPHN|nr:peptidoglycan-associated lipoprotein Pal [Sphingomonas panacisoli]QDZ08404.1 peptidoglycan-associated lipoprotein Pal [Sphingomonas panacisoli]
MATTTTKLILLAALVATAGCATKRPKVLPPSAGDTPVTDNSGNNGYGNGAVVPGSPQDFQRSVMSDTIHFALDMYDIDATSRSILDTQATWLLKWPDRRITIEGHADERGTREYNLALGDRRANAAKNYLAAKGINPARITTISYGKERPIALGSDEASWAQNRRAVTIVLQ